MAFNFGIPFPNMFSSRGSDGQVRTVKGSKRPYDDRMGWAGDWSATKKYIVSQVVTNNNTRYVCIKEHKNQEPPNADYWETISSAGVKSDEYVVAADGTADYTTISGAFVALGTSAGTIRIKAGNYVLGEKVLFTGNNQSIIGSGYGTHLSTSGNHIVIDGNSKDRLLVQNLRVNGSGKGGGSTANVGIDFNGCDDCVVRGCWIKDCGGTGVTMGGNNIITECFIEDNTGDGISAGNNGVIQGCQIIDHTDAGIQSNASFLVINGCYIYHNDNEGIRLGVSAFANCITGNYIANTGQGTGSGDGIQIANYSNENTVTGNVIKNNDEYGVNVKGSNAYRNVIVGNVLNNNSTADIVSGANSTVGLNAT
jgi:hypothetical protein